MMLDLIQEELFLIPSGSFAQNAINFGTCMTSFRHANSRRKNIRILGEEFSEGLDDTTLYTEKCILLISV